MVDTPARIEFLKKIHLFYGLEEGELAAVAEQLEESPYSAGSVIFQQDTKADSFYLIYSGSVKIIRKSEKKERVLATLVRDDYFGEMALLDKRRRSGTCTAMTDTLLFILSRDHFEKLLKRAPHLRRNFDLAIRSRQLAGSLQFKWLAPDEVIYFLARKHPVILYRNLILPFLTLFIPAGLLYARFTIGRSTIVLVAGLLSLIAIIFWIIWLRIDWGNDYYIVTNRRVVWLEKVVGIYDSRQESPLTTVLSVGVETDQLGRILDYGNVIVRTFVGKIPFNHVIHPYQAQKMIEEHQKRTQDRAGEMEKEAIKNAIRKQLNLPIPSPPKTDAAAPVAPQPKRASILRFLGANTLKLRYEQGENVIYRKHWFVLVEQAWLPLLCTLGVLVVFLYRVFKLAFLPNEALVSLQGGLNVDAFAGALLIALFPLTGWLLYQIVDWSNDKFEVTPDQIIDIDRKPFSMETRNAAQLENILGTEYKRLGILGNLFNYGTVYITVGGTKLAFEDVMDPAGVQSDIDRRRMARRAKQEESRVAAERERMATWLATYHHSAGEFNSEEEKKKDQKPE